MKRKTSAPVSCVLCGRNPSSTMDHVPPLSVFPKPRPNNLVKVPACSDCNNGSSVLDEEFGVFVCAVATVERGDSNSVMYHQRVVKPLRHNRRLYNQAIEKADLVELRTKSGIVFGEAYATYWNVSAHDSVIERTVRGLYYHHFGVMLHQRADFDIIVYSSWPAQLLELSLTLALGSMGEQTFVYRYGRIGENPNVSVWMLQFHEAHMVAVFTE